MNDFHKIEGNVPSAICARSNWKAFQLLASISSTSISSNWENDAEYVTWGLRPLWKSIHVLAWNSIVNIARRVSTHYIASRDIWSAMQLNQRIHVIFAAHSTKCLLSWKIIGWVIRANISIVPNVQKSFLRSLNGKCICPPIRKIVSPLWNMKIVGNNRALDAIS